MTRRNPWWLWVVTVLFGVATVALCTRIACDVVATVQMDRAMKAREKEFFGPSGPVYQWERRHPQDPLGPPRW
jgi:hypothetical protein